jgi:hypothetical protein
MAILLGIFLVLIWLVISELLVTILVIVMKMHASGFVMFNIVCTGMFYWQVTEDGHDHHDTSV